ncbi:ATP-binding protein [Chenggangzhangella methanolivorans]|uniref:ATP-binding protein n=1 Tax=Chenggangzhangella methanolivorans TaxID=1437009 RepID=A0A9E6RDC8_9HYPH|nr:ATP-binding protein [Chenggangzhangella methanolivorans]QZO01239.1 ATP-binding protein [Chenggangzhangella methanolivorans]
MGSDDRRRAIGKVTSVAADRFVIEMLGGTDNFTVVGFDDLHYVARLGSFIMIPAQSEYVVAEVVGLRERDVAGGAADWQLEKASSAKYLDVVPVGMLPADGDRKFRFGISIFPSLYADALYALDGELDRIFDTETDTIPALGHNGADCVPAEATRYRNLGIGQSVVFEDYAVKVRIDDFFGGHVAVLGNTGSGKSCTVASILQALFEKPDEHHARGATFVVLDVNGEYDRAFARLPEVADIGVKRLILDGTASPDRFRLPHWYLDLSEWELLLQASERTQVPILRMALGLATLFGAADVGPLNNIRNHMLATCITLILSDETPPGAKETRIRGILQRFSTAQINPAQIGGMIGVNWGNMAGIEAAYQYLAGGGGHAGFIIPNLKLPDYDGTPFDFSALGDAIDLALLYEEAHGNRQIRDYCAQMVTRFKALEERGDYRFLRHNAVAAGDRRMFLATLLGLEPIADGHTKGAQIVILDMNAVEDEVVELVSAVIARMVFRLLRQADPRNRFPVHLLLEEAHRYVASTPSRHAVDASRIFERISKEGRKYGLFLLVASQRPSELSKTVLSQCSNFVVHRIQNPDDLSQIRQMTPFISDSVLRRLPSLPKQHALVFGNSVNLPTTFRVRKADPLPASDDAKIVDLWFHEAGRPSLLPLGPAEDGAEGHD